MLLQKITTRGRFFRRIFRPFYGREIRAGPSDLWPLRAGLGLAAFWASGRLERPAPAAFGMGMVGGWWGKGAGRGF